jgi:hypothetical protein
MRIVAAKDYRSYTGADDRSGARWGSAVMVARFEADIQDGGILCTRRGFGAQWAFKPLLNGMNLGMGAATA